VSFIGSEMVFFFKLELKFSQKNKKKKILKKKLIDKKNNLQKKEIKKKI